MINNFIAGLPVEGGPLVSADIRNNLTALDVRTGKIGTHATVPASTSITTDTGIVYFSDRIVVDISAQQLNLGDLAVGVSSFRNIGFFKDIVIVARLDFNTTTNRYEASTIFLEGPEKSSSTSQPELVPLRSTDLPVARFVVRNNGINISSKGQILPIADTDILDYRNYLDVGGGSYYSASVGDRLVQTDSYGVLVPDAYGAAIITGQTAGTFVGNTKDAYGSIINPIQQAINSVSLTGGTVFIKRGLYQISQTITVPDNVQIIGEGYASTIQMLDTFTGPLFSVTGKHVQFSSLRLLGPLPGNVANLPLIYFVNTSSCTVKDCFIEAGLIGIQCYLSSRNMLTNNYFDNNSIAIKLDGSTKNIVSSNQFTNNTTNISGASGNNTSTDNVT